MSETADMKMLDEFIQSTDRYYHLLKNDTGDFMYHFWMKRRRERIVTPSLPNYERMNKDKARVY